MVGNQTAKQASSIESFNTEELGALKLMAAAHLLARRQPIPKGGPTKMLNCRIPQALQAELRRVAAERGVTVTAAIQQAIRAWVAPQPR